MRRFLVGWLNHRNADRFQVKGCLTNVPRTNHLRVLVFSQNVDIEIPWLFDLGLSALFAVLHFRGRFLHIPSMTSTKPLRAPAAFMINRRRFLQTASVTLALSALGAETLEVMNQKPKRVGLIGTGWYGKSDLFRLIQVAPVEVISLCDVDKHLLSEAADLVSQRQKSKKKPRTYHDYRQMLAEKDLDIVLSGTPDHWHALQMIAAVESGADVYVQKPISVDVLEG